MSALDRGSILCDGRYRLDEVVGRGGMALVWRATDLQLERPVAIKVISDVLAGDERFVARFEREARLAAGLSHPNLVKLFDYSIEAGRPFLVMEYVPGGTLAQAGTHPDPVALARDLLDALAHIHGTGILHRDVKPANVLLGADGSPRLTDFGIARGEEQTGLTLTGQVMGTLRFIAPEVAEGRPSTARSDLYSLGVLLRDVAGDPPPPALAGLLARLTARDPSGRPASAGDALAELTATRPLPQSAAADPGLDATAALPRSGPLRTHSPPRRRPSRRWVPAAAAVAAVVAVVAIANSGGSPDLQRAARTATRAQGPPALQPAAAGAPLDQQLGRLEQMVRAAPRRR